MKEMREFFSALPSAKYDGSPVSDANHSLYNWISIVDEALNVATPTDVPFSRLAINIANTLGKAAKSWCNNDKNRGKHG